MKQGKSLITFVILAIFAVLCIYFGYYVYQAVNEPYHTTLVYSYTADDSVEAAQRHHTGGAGPEPEDA